MARRNPSSVQRTQAWCAFRQNWYASMLSVDRCDIRMVERGQHLRFPHESCEPLAVVDHRFGQHFDSHLAFQVGVGRPVHLTHGARAEAGTDLIRTKAGAATDCHAVLDGDAIQPERN